MRTSALVALTLAACGPTADLDLALVQSEVIPTVFTASVDGEAAGLDAVWVEFGLDGEFTHRAPLDLAAGPPWEIDLLGMKSGSDYQVRIAIELEGESYEGRSHSASTGMVPADFPDLSLERGSGESFEGFLFTSVLGNASAAVILDEDGDYVWWYQPDGIEMVGRTFPSRDGRSVYTMNLNPDGRRDGSMVVVSLDGSEIETTDLDYAHHEIYEHDDGTIAYLSKDPAMVEGSEVSGDSVVELSPDGSSTTIWTIWDYPDRMPYETGGGGPALEWPHANALDYLPDEDVYLIGFLTMDAIARIDRATGEIDWIMGGDNSDFQLSDGGTDLFDRTHQLHWLDDSVLVFVNGSQQGGESYAVEYAVDEQNLEVESIWEYHSDPSVSCISLGDVHRFDSGNTLITYSYSGLLQEVTPGGEPVWTLQAGAGGVISYVTPVDGLYGE